jgi:hypothetical protein
VTSGIIHRHREGDKTLLGITLWRWEKFQVELWICPPNFSVGEHVHHEMDGEIVLLIGNVNLCKRVNGEIKSTGRHFKKLSVPRNTPHFFTQKSSRRIPTVFINMERWVTKPTSASVDFEKV